MSTLSTFIKRLRDIMRNDAGVNGDAQRIEQIAWMLFLKVYDSKEEDWELEEDDYQSIIPDDCRWCNWAHDDGSGRVPTGDTLLDFVNNRLFPTLKTLPVSADMPVKKSVVQSVFQDANNYMKDGVLLRQVINVIDDIDLSDYEEVHAFGEIYETLLHELQSAGSSGEFYTPRAVTQFMAKMIKPRIGETMADLACGTGGFITSFLNELEPQIQTTDDQEKYARCIYGIEKKQFPYILCVTNLLLHGIDEPNVHHDNALTIHNLLDFTEDESFDVLLMNPPYGGNEKPEVKQYFPADLASSETADLFLDVMMYRLKPGGRAAVVLPDGFLFGTDNAKLNIKKKLLTEFNLHTVVRLPGSVFSPYTSITTNILFFDRTGPTQETWFYRLDMPEGYKHFSKTKPMRLEHFTPVMDWWENRQAITVDGFDKAKKYTAAQLADELGYNLDQCGFPHEEEEILDPMDLILRYQEERASLNAEVDNTLAVIRNVLSGERTLHGYLKQQCALRRLIEIDRRFPEDMQKSILQLAIQGKLVEQRTEEGTAEELFYRIQKERIETDKEQPIIGEDEFEFDIPDTWKWVRIKNIAILINGRAYKQSELQKSGKYPILRVGNLFTNPEWYYSDMELDPDKYCNSGDLLYSWSASFGPHIWTGNKVIYHYHIWKIVHSEFVLQKYLYYFLLADTDSIKRSGHGLAMIHVTKTGTEQRLVPLPPIAEQKRIVAKLEELLPLCEKLR